MTLFSKYLFNFILKRGRIFIYILPLFITVACTSVHIPTKTSLLEKNIPTYHKINAVPVIEQADHYCGPAALATVAQYNKRSLSQAKAASMVYTKGRKGTFQHDIVSAIQRLNLLAVPVRSPTDLFIEISQNYPVLIFQNLGLSWYPTWHYSVISGYDIDEENVFIHDGTAQAKWQSMSTVFKTWKRTENWGYIAVSPGTIPKTATAENLLQSTAQLEAAGHLESAKQSYKAILDHFPKQHAAYFGLGNIAVTEKNYGLAIKNYKSALSLKTDYVPALNNLGYAYSFSGDTQKACDHLNRYKTTYTSLKDSYDDLCIIKK